MTAVSPMRPSSVATAVLLAMLIPAAPAAAECAWHIDPVRTAFKGALHVFVADVVSEALVLTDQSASRHVTFRVIERLKDATSSAPSTFDFTLEVHQFFFKADQRVLVYIFGTSDSGNTSCSPTRVVTLDDPEIGFLRGLAAENAGRPPDTAVAGTQAAAPILADVVATRLPGWRFARRDDVSRVLGDSRNGGKPEYLGDVVFQADFDGDGRQDWATIVIDEQGRRYRAYFVLNRVTGPWLDRLFERQWTARPTDGVIRNPMFLKRPGEIGPAQRSYNTLVNRGAEAQVKTDESARRVDAYRRVAAVEIWRGQIGYDQDYGAIERMAYCSETFYYEAGELRTFTACD